MRSLKLIGLPLLAVFALGSFATSAFAEEGFLESGTPKTANVLGGKSTLSVLKSTEPIVCEKLDASTIAFTNDSTSKGTLRWLGCKAGNFFGVNSLGDKAEEILVAVKFTVCLSPNNSGADKFGIAAEVQSSVHLEAPAIGVLDELLGTALGAVLTTGVTQLFSVEFLSIGTPGDQTVTLCGTIKHTLALAKNHEAEIDAALEVSGGLSSSPTRRQRRDDAFLDLPLSEVA
jgi:hypothetical protein